MHEPKTDRIENGRRKLAQHVNYGSVMGLKHRPPRMKESYKHMNLLPSLTSTSLCLL